MNRYQAWPGIAAVVLGSIAGGCSKSEPAPTASAEPAAPSNHTTPPNSAMPSSPSSAPSAVVPVSASQPAVQADPIVVLHTTAGDLYIRLYEKQAPRTVSSFLGYVRSGFYDGTVFHQIVTDYIALGGSFDQRMQPKMGRYPIPNEATNGLKNVRGSIAMARNPADPQSATSAFFINLADNAKLDHRGTSNEEFGYCVFGQVIDGMDVLRKLSAASSSATKVIVNAVKVVPMRDVQVQQATPRG